MAMRRYLNIFFFPRMQVPNLNSQKEEKMNACAAVDFAPSIFSFELESSERNAIPRCAPTSAGTFPLRRALYFSGSVKPVMAKEQSSGHFPADSCGKQTPA
jgi:hypothetical protein